MSPVHDEPYVASPGGSVRCADPATAPDPLYRLIAAHEAALDLGGWDVPPTMQVITGTEDNPALALLPVPISMWDASEGHPDGVLAGYAKWITEHGRLPDIWPRSVLGVPVPFVGLLSCNEAWGVAGEAARRDIDARKRAPSRRRVRFEHRPDRIESRLLLGFTATGRQLCLARPRGGEPYLVEFCGADLEEVLALASQQAQGASFIRAVRGAYDRLHLT